MFEINFCYVPTYLPTTNDILYYEVNPQTGGAFDLTFIFFFKAYKYGAMKNKPHKTNIINSIIVITLIAVHCSCSF